MPLKLKQSLAAYNTYLKANQMYREEHLIVSEQKLGPLISYKFEGLQKFATFNHCNKLEKFITHLVK